MTAWPYALAAEAVGVAAVNLGLYGRWLVRRRGPR